MNASFLEPLGWTLLHSLWQLSALAAIAFIALVLLRKRSAASRYLVGYAFLLLMLFAPLATYPLMLPRPSSPASISNPVHSLRATPAADIAPITFHLTLPVTAHPSLADRIQQLLQPALPITALAYLAITLLLTLRLLLGHRALRRLRSTSLPALAAHHDLLTSLQQHLHLRRPILLRTSEHIDVPTTFGSLRPLILLPATALTGLSEEHLRYLLLHELAHIRRHDYAANLLQSLIDTLLFYHPAVYWLSALIRQEREHCCDDLTLTTLGSPRTYAEALTHMESLRASPTLALGARSGSLLHRIHRILKIPMPNSFRSRALTSSAVSTAAAAAVLSFYLVACTHNAVSMSAAPARLERNSSPPPKILTKNVDIYTNSQTFESFLNQLAATYDLKIAPNWSVLEKAGISKTSLVAVHLHDVPLEKAIKTVMSSLDTSTHKTIAAEMRNNVIVISTAEDLEKTTPTVLRTYDVRDLLVQPTAPPLTGPGGSQGSPAQSPEQARNAVVKLLTNVIQSTVAPDSWRDNGGTIGAIQEIQGFLLITQTSKNQDAIDQVLAVMRKAHNLQIAIETRIMVVDETQFQKLASRYPALLDGLMHPDGNVGADLLNTKAVTDLLADITNNGNSISVASPRITLFNAQQGSIQIVREQGYVSGAHAAPGTSTPTLETSKVTRGVVVSIEATSSPDRKSVVMKLELELRQLIRFDEKPLENYPGLEHAAIQTPIMDIHKIASLFSIPDGQVAFIGGPKITKGLETPASPPIPPHNTYHVLLLVRPKIIAPK